MTVILGQLLRNDGNKIDKKSIYLYFDLTSTFLELVNLS
jgi:hypothetical protein